MNKVFFLAFLFIITAKLDGQNTNISVTITDIRNDKGQILYALYDNADSFNDEKSFIKSGAVKASKGSINFIIKNIPDGDYALSILHDENNNNTMDFNILGIPKEGFAFSMDPTIRFRQPDFYDCVFSKKGHLSISIKMKYFL